MNGNGDNIQIMKNYKELCNRNVGEIKKMDLTSIIGIVAGSCEELTRLGLI